MCRKHRFIVLLFFLEIFNYSQLFQIVCGISALVMGSVAFIEEKGKLNLGLGIPAGGATILAAGIWSLILLQLKIKT